MSPFYSSDDSWAPYIISILLKNHATYMSSYLWMEENKIYPFIPKNLMIGNNFIYMK